MNAKTVLLALILCFILAVLLVFVYIFGVDSEESGIPAGVIGISDSTSIPSQAGTNSEAHSNEPPEQSEQYSSEESEKDQNPKHDPPYKNIPDIKSSDITESELDKFFNDSIFIGNSLMSDFGNFINYKRSVYPDFMGKSKIFARPVYSAFHDKATVTDKSWHPSYMGEKTDAAGAVKKSRAKTVYVSLMGLNDLGMYHNPDICVEKTFSGTVGLIERILEQNPETVIVVISNTYIIKDKNDDDHFNNKNISELNNLMLDYCNENGYDFIDVSTPSIFDGNLDDNLCTDKKSSGHHLNSNAYAMWTAVLRNYSYSKQNGSYNNPDSMPIYKKG